MIISKKTRRFLWRIRSFSSTRGGRWTLFLIAMSALVIAMRIIDALGG